MSPTPTLLRALALLLLSALPSARAQAAWNFTLSSYPAQCTPFSLSFSGGSAPHTFTFLSLAGIGTNFSSWATGGRYDFTPDQDPSGTITSELTLPFAEGSSVVVVGSDADGWATGGTSALYTLGSSSSGDGSCLQTYDNASYQDTVLSWAGDPPQQCETMESVFDNVVLPVEILVVVPGGESFVVESPAVNTTNNTDGFNPPMVYTLLWAIPVPEQTDIAYLVSDANGQLFVSGLTTVGAGNSSCLQGGEFTVTAAPYAGAVSTSGASGSSGGPNVGAIVGGVVGGVGGAIVLLLVGLFLLHRHNKQKRQERVKRNSVLLTYPESRRSQIIGDDKEAWAQMPAQPEQQKGAQPRWERNERVEVQPPRPPPKVQGYSMQPQSILQQPGEHQAVREQQSVQKQPIQQQPVQQQYGPHYHAQLPVAEQYATQQAPVQQHVSDQYAAPRPSQQRAVHQTPAQQYAARQQSSHRRPPPPSVTDEHATQLRSATQSSSLAYEYAAQHRTTQPQPVQPRSTDQYTPKQRSTQERITQQYAEQARRAEPRPTQQRSVQQYTTQERPTQSRSTEEYPAHQHHSSHRRSSEQERAPQRSSQQYQTQHRLAQQASSSQPPLQQPATAHRRSSEAEYPSQQRPSRLPVRADRA